MSIKARLEDAEILYQNERHEGVLLLLLVAIAATSRKRYPKKQMGDGEAFKTFLGEEMKTLTGNIENLNILFRDKLVPLQDVLYKFVRCELTHEARLPSEVILEKRAPFFLKITKPGITVSDSLLQGLARVVTEAPENEEIFRKRAH